MPIICKILLATFVISHIVKIPLNWNVWNKNDPKNKIKLKVGYYGPPIHDGTKNSKESNDSNFLFLISNFILFWVNIPKDKTGKIMAWSVTALSIIQAISIFFIFRLDCE